MLIITIVAHSPASICPAPPSPARDRAKCQGRAAQSHERGLDHPEGKHISRWLSVPSISRFGRGLCQARCGRLQAVPPPYPHHGCQACRGVRARLRCAIHTHAHAQDRLYSISVRNGCSRKFVELFLAGVWVWISQLGDTPRLLLLLLLLLLVSLSLSPSIYIYIYIYIYMYVYMATSCL